MSALPPVVGSFPFSRTPPRADENPTLHPLDSRTLDPPLTEQAAPPQA